MGLLESKVAIVSGVGAGLGRDVALRFAEEGADVALVARTSSVTARVAQEVHERGRRAFVIDADVSEPGEAQRVAMEAEDALGPAHVLVNVASTNNDFQRFLDVSPDMADWRAMFAVNVFGSLMTTRAVAERMIDAGIEGRIVMIGSVSSEKVQPGSVGYTGSKSAVAHMTRALALELGPYGIRVNSMHPGWMWGPRVEKLLAERAEANGTTLEAERAAVDAQCALGYIPDTAEYAGTVLYLASDLARPVTGQSLHVNAGLWFH